MAADVELLLWPAGGVALGLLAFLRGFRAWRRLRLIEDLPTTRVRSLALGRVELAGRARGRAALEAPLTGTPCVYYRYLVEEEVGSGRSRRWKALARGDSADAGFHLEDGTGQVLVDPRGAELELSPVWRATDPPLSAPLLRTLARHGIDPHGWLFRRRLRFTEWRLACGDPLYLLGVAQERPGLAAERRERVSERLRAVRRDPAALAALDADGDGRVDAQEWEAARVEAVRAVAAEAVADRIAVAAAPGPSGAPFYISDRPERAVAARQRWRALGGIYGGAALAVGCGALLVRELGRVGRF
jgi:hypothetical protein